MKSKSIIGKILWLNTLFVFVLLYLLESESINGMWLVLVTAGLAILGFVIYVINSKGKLKIKTTAFHIHVLLFIVFCYTSSLWAFNGSYSILRANTILEIYLILLLINVMLEDNYTIDEILQLMMVGGYVIVILAMLYYGSNFVVVMLKTGLRIENDFLNANVLGMLAANSIIINTYYILYKKRINWWVFFSALCLVILVVSMSKKAIIQLTLGLLLVFVFHAQSKKILTSLFKTVGIIICFFMAVYFLSQLPVFESIRTRFEIMINIFWGRGEISTSDLTRVRLTELGMQLFKQNPILGIGMDNAKLFTYSIGGTNFYLHNNYAELLAGGGIVGFTCYYSMYIHLLVSWYKNRKYRDSEYDICLVLILLRAFLEYGSVSYYSKSNYFFFLVFFLKMRELKLKRKSEIGYDTVNCAN